MSKRPETSRAPSSRRARLARLHLLAKDRGLDDDAYRDLLERETGKRSARDCSEAEIARVCDTLGRGSAGGQTAASGPFAAKLRALWVSAWHLAITRSNSDDAMCAFVRRQTGIEHTRFLIEPRAANKAIEGLKAWIARDGGVEWGDDGSDPRRAVVEAQVRRLQAIGAVQSLRGSAAANFLEDYACHVSGKRRGLEHLTEADWDRVIAALGARLRRAQANHKERT